jgi:hypothetical protein
MRSRNQEEEEHEIMYGSSEDDDEEYQGALLVPGPSSVDNDDITTLASTIASQPAVIAAQLAPETEDIGNENDWNENNKN